MGASITCSFCGQTFDPTGQAACSSCPLQSGCHMVCCPSCGYTTVDAQQSSMVKLASKIFKRHQINPKDPTKPTTPGEEHT